MVMTSGSQGSASPDPFLVPLTMPSQTLQLPPKSFGVKTVKGLLKGQVSSIGWLFPFGLLLDPWGHSHRED